MRARMRMAAGWLFCLVAPACAAQASVPPTIDCALGFDGLRIAADALPGIEHVQNNGFHIVTLSAPKAWGVSIAFTRPGHPAHPAVTMRTSRKQVTNVWISESKGCGFGDSGSFAALMSAMKSEDTRLTNASRADVERRKQERSPLAPMP